MTGKSEGNISFVKLSKPQIRGTSAQCDLFVGDYSKNSTGVLSHCSYNPLLSHQTFSSAPNNLRFCPENFESDFSFVRAVQ
jgi:hypothetical protein